MIAYFQGLVIGLAYVAPIGMQNLFVINSALAQPRRRALLTAAIVTLFDISLAFACYFGIGALVERFVWLQRVVLLAGGGIVIWIGTGLLREKPSLDRTVDMGIPLPKIAAKAFVVTWINPQALIDGTMLFGSFRINNPGMAGTQLILGSATASFLWFFGVTILISCFSARFNDKLLRIINVVCGGIIILYGGKLLWQFFQMIL
jgi:L-lysine exporter family protein LysE/ArgO